MYANQQIEQIDRETLQGLQLTRLKKQMKWAQEKSLFYQNRFKEAGVSYKDLNTLEDLQRFPFLQKISLCEIDALDMLTMPMSSLLRVNIIPKDVGEVTKLYTGGDIAHNVEMMTRALVASGVNNASIVALQGDMSDTRLQDIQYALELIGATVIPMGSDFRQWLRFMELLSMDTLVSTPQLIMQLIIQLQARGKEIKDFPLSRIICRNASGVQNPMQKHIQDRTSAVVYNLFEPAELGTAGILYQCEKHNGYHVQEDYYYPEIVAFNSDTVITEPHQMGELVLTTLVAEAMPLIRYRTGQAVMIESEPCECQRTLRRVMTPFSFV